MRIASVVIFMLTVTAALPAAPRLSFEQRAIVVSGLTPRTAVVLYAVANEWFGYAERVEHAGIKTTADAAGAIRLERGRDVPPRSVWIAADIASGDFTIASPTEQSGRASALPEAALTRAAGGIGARLKLKERDLELIFIRPKAGAWLLQSFSTFALEQMQPLGDSPAPPAEFERGDILIVVDPGDATLQTLRVK